MSICFAFSVVILGIGICSTNIGLYSKNPPILRGRDVCRYGYEWANLWIINTHNGIKGDLERIHIEDYPAIKQHLDKYWDKIEPRADQGDTAYNLRNCAYLDEFSKPKIVWGNLNTFGSYAIAPENMFINAPACMIVPGNTYLLAVLNSKIADYYLRTLGVVRNGRISSAVLTRSSSSMQFARISSRFSDVMINASLHPVKTPLYISTSHSLRGTPTDSTLHLILCSISLSIVQDSLLNDDF